MKYDSMIKTEYGDFLPPKGKKVANIFGANAWHSLGLKPTNTIVGEAYEIPGTDLLELVFTKVPLGGAVLKLPKAGIKPPA